MNGASALPAHYRDAGEATGSDGDLRPTPGIAATEHGDPGVRSDMERINEHWRRRGKRPEQVKRPRR